VKLKDIAALLEGEVRGNGGAVITGVAGAEQAGEGQITFLAGKKRLSQRLAAVKASCVLVEEFVEDASVNQLRVDDPQYAFALLLGQFYPRTHGPLGVSELAYVARDVHLGEDVSVRPFAYLSPGARLGHRTVVYSGVYVGREVEVGEDCVLYPNVVLMPGTRLGDRCIIHAGSVVGADGFGYLQREGRNVKVPQVGGVDIGDDVEIGACTTIDRATTGNTVIGEGTKIDNLVQVAHNVTIGPHSVIVAQVGIAGSSKLGDHVMLGGQAGMADHVEIASGVMLGGRTGVMQNIDKPGVYSGLPAMPHRDWLRTLSMFAKLPEMHRRIAELEEKLDELTKEQSS
jgi:UDP-3-O-[3-hydroxymyristoyl] glucosamine N-acyltransferase